MINDAVSTPPPEGIFRLVTDQWTEPFWSACRDHQLIAPRCANCGTFRMPPTPFCPACRSQSLDWPVLSGRGVLYSYTIVNRAISPEMAAALPYVPAVVELPDADGVRLITNVIGIPLSMLRVGLPLKLSWVDRQDGVALPCFEVDV